MDQLKHSPQVECPFESEDLEYLSRFSTLLVATIEEVKDRISQIEYIFCSQLYPNVQEKCKSLQTIYSEARKVAEDAWKEKESYLLLKIEQLEVEKDEALAENQSLKLEKVKSSKEDEEKANRLHAKLKNKKSVIDKLQLDLMKKSKEVEQQRELQNKLLQLIQSKASVIVSKGKQLKEFEEKNNALLAETKEVERRIGDLGKVLIEKNEQIAKEKTLSANLFKKIEVQASEIINYEQLISNRDKERNELLGKLQDEIRRKNQVIEEKSKLHRQLMQQNELNSSEMEKSRQCLVNSEREKIQLVSKVKDLEKKVDESTMSLRARNGRANDGRDSNEKLLQEIESKTSELMAEKKKRRDIIDAYKRLKSQYNFLCTKFGLTTESMMPQVKSEDPSDSPRDRQNSLKGPDHENKPRESPVAYDESKVKTEISSKDIIEDEKAEHVQTLNCQSPNTSIPVASKPFSTVKSAPVAGKKRRACGWIETRFRQRQVGPDPHDDFLDTPLEEIRGNLNKATKEQGEGNAAVAAKDASFGGSDDETQDLSAELQQKEQMPDPTAGKRGFKYVETVRKKAEREDLKGFECKQCKKFYDAVLPDDGGKDGNTSKYGFRCEHHDGVSRHRYKYVPPMTPEGFWNIGFESEM